LLKKVLLLVKTRGFKIINLDTTIIAQAPKISLHRLKIEKRIAKLLNLKLTAVNLKATSTEGLGDIGKNKAIAAWCVTLIKTVK
ncbi:MAG: 2-C-methyl-D-erythritol 2,4-cyclodiphosphate synthase, partial [Candidatus Omnitrophica bacterium]|nr:2-C-methyl-D-erythritol 2,4-cyclodiphosphate synthase [Candidatus Omnitrophota bacterium]